MRKLRACIHIKAPVHTVQRLAEPGWRRQWLAGRGGVLLRTVAESWEVKAVDGGTEFTLRMEYKARLPFLEAFVGGGVSHQVAHSLSRLKELAETEHPQGF